MFNYEHSSITAHLSLVIVECLGTKVFYYCSSSTTYQDIYKSEYASIIAHLPINKYQGIFKSYVIAHL